MLTMTVQTDFDDRACLARFGDAFARAAGMLGDAVLADSTPYVPYDTGRLADSGVRGAVTAADGAAVCDVMWRTPYAADVYYGDLRGVCFRREHRPHARARWFEGAKAVGCGAWTETVRAAVRAADT